MMYCNTVLKSTNKSRKHYSMESTQGAHSSYPRSRWWCTTE